MIQCLKRYLLSEANINVGPFQFRMVKYLVDLKAIYVC